MSKNDIEHIITATPDIIERVLKVSHSKIKAFVDKKKNPEGDVKEEIPKEQEFHKVAKNQELREVLSEKDNAIKELKSTVEVASLSYRFSSWKSKKWSSSLKSRIARYRAWSASYNKQAWPDR